MNRRNFIQNSSLAAAALATGLSATATTAAAEVTEENQRITNPLNPMATKYRPLTKSGFGGVALGNGFQVNSDLECEQAMEAAWNAGVRYFDTSPWYGLGISERRMGLFLKDKQRADYTLSTKVGRLLEPHENFTMKDLLWKGKMNFGYRYDYSAAGARRSVEDSLQRLGISSLDIVYIHDLSPDNGDMKTDWLKYFATAQNGAMKELTKMREEGLIKGWGLGVNTIEPIVKTLQVADPDIFLSACQYSLIQHEADLSQVFPLAAAKGVSIVVGAPLSAGFLAGKNRYLYGGTFPPGVQEKLAALKQVAANHRVDLRTAALQFSAAPAVVSGVIPGAHTAQQAQENAASFTTQIPAGFWQELKQKKLITEAAPVPV
ncbi:MAG: aldo/keto reductase [Janthinobacterium lividum]